MIKESKGHPGREEAEALAIRGLGFLAGDPEALGRFLGITGLGPGTLRSAAADPGFLISVLDYFLSDERLLVAFAAAEGLPASAIPAARGRLGPGGG